jgi:CDGSH iron-sulfur domain-containing protein 3
MTATPARGGDAPIRIDVKAGETYWWCTCGLSQSQPFCDGSHKAEDVFAPMEYTATEDRPLFFCTCKATSRAPFCDGSHNPPR